VILFPPADDVEFVTDDAPILREKLPELRVADVGREGGRPDDVEEEHSSEAPPLCTHNPGASAVHGVRGRPARRRPFSTMS
jgi:hypothetical protein